MLTLENWNYETIWTCYFLPNIILCLSHFKFQILFPNLLILIIPISSNLRHKKTWRKFRAYFFFKKCERHAFCTVGSLQAFQRQKYVFTQQEGRNHHTIVLVEVTYLYIYIIRKEENRRRRRRNKRNKKENVFRKNCFKYS